MTVIITHRCDSCGVETQTPEDWEEVVDDEGFGEDLCPRCFRAYLAALPEEPASQAPEREGDR